MNGDVPTWDFHAEYTSLEYKKRIYINNVTKERYGIEKEPYDRQW